MKSLMIMHSHIPSGDKAYPSSRKTRYARPYLKVTKDLLGSDMERLWIRPILCSAVQICRRGGGRINRIIKLPLLLSYFEGIKKGLIKVQIDWGFG